MITTDELRETFAEHASRAPDSAGLIEIARAGAARVHRRRRFAAAAAAVTVVCALAAVAVLRPQDGRPPVTAEASTSRFFTTVEVAPGSGWRVEKYTFDGRTHSVEVVGTDPDARGTIRVLEPGTYDRRGLRDGEAVTVGGHRVRYRPDGTVGWEDSSRRGVVVSGTPNRDTVIRLAAAVRLTPPVPIRSPVLLSESLAALLPWSVDLLERGSRERLAVTFADPAWSGRVPLLLMVETRTADTDFKGLFEDLEQLRVGDYDALLGWPAPDGSRSLRLATPTCVVYMTVDLGIVPAEELVRIAGAARYADCTRPETWFDIP